MQPPEPSAHVEVLVTVGVNARAGRDSPRERAKRGTVPAEISADPIERLLEDAAAVAASGRAAPPPTDLSGRLLPYLQQYWRHVAAEDLLERDPVDIYGAALSHAQLAGLRAQGTAQVRAFTPTVDEHCWQSGHTVVEVVTDDMPFLVDSVTAELSRGDHGIHLVVHPILQVRRDLHGNLLEVLAGDDATDADSSVPAGSSTAAVAEPTADGFGLRESWIHVEIDRLSQPDQLSQIESDLLRVLRDVRESVEDWPKILSMASDVARSLRAEPPPLPPAEINEAEELFDWLVDDHFTFLGYREYRLAGEGEEERLEPVTGTGLGILRDDPSGQRRAAVLPPRVRALAREHRLLVLTKANSRSTVHRPTYLDYIGVKVFEDGEVVGERRFLGVFTSVAYTESIREIPVLRQKAEELFALTGARPGSHSARALLDVLQTYPRDELFGVDAAELLPTLLAVMQLQERRRLRMFLRTDPYGRYVSVLIYMPRDRFTTSSRLKMQEILLRAFGGNAIDFTLRHSESVLTRIHFVVRLPVQDDLPEVDAHQLESELVQAVRTWPDDFAEAAVESFGEELGTQMIRRYEDAFDEAYRADFTARQAAGDIRVLEELPEEGGLRVSLYYPVGGAAANRRLKLYRTGTPLSLSALMPVLSAMGLQVSDERPYPITRSDGSTATVYDLGIAIRHARTGLAPGAVLDHARGLFAEAFVAVWRRLAESDPFNALVLHAGMSWREVVVFRAYARYLRQCGTTFSDHYLAQTVVGNVAVAKLLLQMFAARFDPSLANDEAGQERIAAEIETALGRVSILDEDRILRSFLNLIRTTLRTNYYQPGPDGQLREAVSFKFDSRANPELPKPKPVAEIWVYSPRVEGVHLRFGAIARGGLRWSDRREDFRTEVLGLVKAQTVKNAVIVPMGAKGGFFPKHLPDPAEDREAFLAEGISCYRTFVSGLLDITDNIVDGQVVPPVAVVRHDGDDPYLVVAADKGTATFSDIANAVAADYGFWLGDAFASGGSAGYDHKEMGITARGTWESVKRHFRELGVDCQATDFTCVGIGDMSGDVFGNGLLLSRHTRLVAAFDHRHVFVDPDPDAAASWDERKRLFELPRSSWDDYDHALISPGGGVFARSMKSVPISAEMRSALGITEGVDNLTPAELIRCILAAPVDLLFNGGIGTYVKAANESHAQVGDRANDAVRIDGTELRARCVGEGGNLGLTQAGRVEYASAGGLLTTDFIDNSAGVDTSDHEVNIKILLDRVVSAGDMTLKQRNALLASMTDEVAALVLSHNASQNVALSCARSQSHALAHVHDDWMCRLEATGELDRRLEGLPTSAQLSARQQAGAGLTEPELSVLLAYTKISLTHELLASDLPEDEDLFPLLVDYFPKPMRERFSDRLHEHRLHREIIATRAVNEMVDFGGITMYPRLSAETGAAVADIARAHVAARTIFRTESIWVEITKLDNVISAAGQTRARLATRLIAERATRWFVNNHRAPLDTSDLIASYADQMGPLIEALPEVLVGRAGERRAQRRQQFIDDGIPPELAARIAVLPESYAGLGMIPAAKRHGIDVVQIARVHAVIGEELNLDRLLDKVLELPRDDQWRTMARAALRDDLNAVHIRIVEQALSAGDASDDDPAAIVAQWRKMESAQLDRVRGLLEGLIEGPHADLAKLQVALRLVRQLVPAA